jgi:hypothetical protein
MYIEKKQEHRKATCIYTKIREQEGADAFWGNLLKKKGKLGVSERTCRERDK